MVKREVGLPDLELEFLRPFVVSARWDLEHMDRISRLFECERKADKDTPAVAVLVSSRLSSFDKCADFFVFSMVRVRSWF